MRRRRVGVLGGMGPQATVLLLQKIITAIPAADDEVHVPLIVDQNPQVPSRIRHLIDGGGDDPGPVLIAMARRLQGAGAEALAMPCNTAHHFADAIRGAVRVPFIDMVELSADHAERLVGPGGTVGILASPATRLVGLFDRALEARGVRPLYCADDDEILSIVCSIKAQGPTEAAGVALAAAANELSRRGSTAQMIACTEFSLIAEAVPSTFRPFDTLDLLTGAVVDFSTRSLEHGGLGAGKD